MSFRTSSLRRIPTEHVDPIEGTTGRTRITASALAGLLIVSAVACSNNGQTIDSTVVTTIATTTLAPTTTTLPPPPMFGDMPSPCGPATDAGTPTVAEGQNPAESLRLGVANDAGFTGAPGTGAEMLDAARAFAEWCNSQGGIEGLTLEVVDLDAQGTGVPLAMEQACAEVFALVGGGWTFDDQMFPRFHECGLVSFPAFTVSAAATKSNGRAQAVPTPIDSDSTTWFDWIASTYPDSIGNIAIIHADTPSTQVLAEKTAAMMSAVGGFGEPSMIAYDPSGAIDWSTIVGRLADANVRAVSFIGAPSNLVDFYTGLNGAGYAPDVVFGDENLLSDTVLEGVAGDALANLRIRAIHGPFTEVEPDPAMTSYTEMLSSIDPPGRAGGLGVLSISSLLLFATAANACLENNGNVLERECTLAQALTIDSWTAGGLHAPTNPSGNVASSCLVVIDVEAGTWSRFHPLRSSENDDRSRCDDDSIVSIEGDFGDVSAGIDSTRLN